MPTLLRLKQRAPQQATQLSKKATRMTKSASLVFHKMHGAGNDFVLLDRRADHAPVSAQQASAIAHRRTGVGCDQLLILHPPTIEGSTARYEVRNADGSAAGQCGNGARCIALYLTGNGESGSGSLLLESPSGPVRIEQCPDGEFEVDMGEPDFTPAHIPIDLPGGDGKYRLDGPDGRIEFGAVSMGNPHALLDVTDVDRAEVAKVGTWLGGHAAFPEGCNIGFGQLVDRENLRLRVHERGAGETLACGSGACAAVAVLRRQDRVDERVNVYLPGGHLVIKWPGPGSSVRMKGPARHVYTGTLSHE